VPQARSGARRRRLFVFLFYPARCPAARLAPVLRPAHLQRPDGNDNGQDPAGLPACASPIPRWNPVTARTVQGMARVRSRAGSGLAFGFLTGVSAVVSGVKRDFACAFSECLVLCSLPYGHSHA
jgi:hypothetical protein